MVPAKTTVSSEYYIHISFWPCFKEPFETSILARSGSIFASEQRSCARESICEVHTLELGKETQPHPPYSLDLAICDFFLFPNVKDQFGGIKYELEAMLRLVGRIISNCEYQFFFVIEIFQKISNL